MSADNPAVGLQKGDEIICEECATIPELRILLGETNGIILEELNGISLVRLSSSDGIRCTRCKELLH